MPISLKFSQDIQFLDDLDVVKFSIRQECDHLKQINKRSRLCNFFHWVIHYITFTLVPQNRELDRITSHILKEIQDELNEATDKERNLAERAIRNLHIIIKNNGGSQCDAIEKMLATLAKIQSLPIVQNLSGKNIEQKDNLFEDSLKAEVPTDTKETESGAPADTKEIQPDALLEDNIPKDLPEAKGPTHQEEIRSHASLDTKKILADDLLGKEIAGDLLKAEASDTEETQSEAAPITINFQETRLQDLLQNLSDRKAFDNEYSLHGWQRSLEAEASIADLLPELKGSVPLSNDQLAVLGKAFERMYIYLNKDLSPGLLTCLVKNSLENANLLSLCPIVHPMMDRGPFEKERFIAFAYGFKLYRNTLKANMPAKEIPAKQMQSFLESCCFYDEISLKNHLSEDEMKDFVQDFFELVVAQTSDDSQEKIANFKTATMLINKFGNQYIPIAVKTLCQVKNVKLLTHICSWENASDFVLETVLKSNPPKVDDPDDSFFQEFVDELMKEIEQFMKKIADDPNDSFDRMLNEFSLKNEEKYVNKIAEYVFANECAERQEILVNKLTLSPGLIVLQLEHIPVQAWQNINDSILLEVADNLINQKSAPTNSELAAFVKGLNADRLYDLIVQNRDNLFK